MTTQFTALSSLLLAALCGNYHRSSHPDLQDQLHAYHSIGAFLTACGVAKTSEFVRRRVLTLPTPPANNRQRWLFVGALSTTCIAAYMTIYGLRLGYNGTNFIYQNVQGGDTHLYRYNLATLLSGIFTTYISTRAVSQGVSSAYRLWKALSPSTTLPR